MLRVVDSFSCLDLSQLMQLHHESICRMGIENYPNLLDNVRQLWAEQDFYADLMDFFSTYAGKYALWAPEGRYLAALRIEPYNDGLLLSGLETTPQARWKGYATALVRAVLSYLSENCEGKLYSHVDKNNNPSLALHKNCGFKRILEYAVYVDGSILTSSCTFCYVL